jgi:hypothetical protein
MQVLVLAGRGRTHCRTATQGCCRAGERMRGGVLVVVVVVVVVAVLVLFTLCQRMR